MLHDCVRVYVMCDCVRERDAHLPAARAGTRMRVCMCTRAYHPPCVRMHFARTKERVSRKLRYFDSRYDIRYYYR